MFTVAMVLEKETKGALRYQEVDESRQPVEQAWAKIGTLYLRKTAFERGTKPPTMLSVAITEVVE